MSFWIFAILAAAFAGVSVHFGAYDYATFFGLMAIGLFTESSSVGEKK